MAYRRPGITVTQEFVGLVPALAEFALPSVSVAPAYQLVDEDLLGTYVGNQQTYAYASLMGGAIVDLEEMAVDEPFPITKKPVEVKLTEVIIEILSQQTTGSGNGTAFSDATLSQFEDVKAGDLLEIVPALGLTIVAAQTNGQTTDTAGQRNRLTTPTAGLFDNVKIGDEVIVTAGTKTNTGTFVVTAKISGTVIVVDNDINDGVGASADVEYSVTGDRGVLSEGVYRIKEKADDNNLILESPLAEAEAPLTYFIKRELGEVELDRVASLSNPGFLPAASGVSLPAGLDAIDDGDPFTILSANVVGSYRALRTDLAANVKDFARLSDLQAFFGLTQITPANPLAYGLQFMLQNTVTSVNGLGLSADFLTNEVLAHQAALDVLGMTEMYALVPMTQNPAVHQIYRSHVQNLSEPERKKERIAIVNSMLQMLEVLASEEAISTALSGSRTIVSTQVDGVGESIINPARLTDNTADAFLFVQPGDSVTIVSGANVTPGTYTVVAKVDNNNLTLSANFNTGASTDIVYFVQRQDGLGANGTTFYDRNATFISSNIAPGHYIRITSGALAGRYLIGAVTSDKELELAEAVLGVTSLETGFDYLVDRDLSKTEQANSVAGHSQSLGSRRVVHIWPDVLQAPVGPTLYDLPGYYGACAIGALVTGLPPQQGFTNLSISGFLGLNHSSGYFTDEQLDLIADGGTMILAQDGPQQALYVRHQLTTDRSAIKFQELSVTKNVDFIAKFLRNNFSSFPGEYNIVDTTLDELKTSAVAQIAFLRNDTRRPKIGGVIRSGELVLLEEDVNQIDTVKMRFRFNIPIPLNNLDITTEV